MKNEIKKVYTELKNRDINPTGSFDNAGRFHAEHSDLISVRPPSRAHPYSEMSACRTLKYVKAVCEKFDCKTVEELRGLV